ncbi:MAG: protein kinase domain-containing protein [Candidatus Brocadiia bacterium]
MPDSDQEFTRIAVSMGYIAQEQADEALRQLAQAKAQGRKETLGHLLLEAGHMNRAQVNAVLKTLRKPRLSHIGKFRLLARIGQGGMGTVYKAKQESLDKIVAVKVLSPALARQRDFVDRFIREAQASGQLNHPNIVLGIDAGEADGYYYFAMEFVDGESLKAVLQRDGKLAERRALQVAAAIASALEHAHEHNIVHRDIKPGNIFLTHEGVPKLGDLGLAKEIRTDHSITQAGIPVGTPYYISPEQVRGEQNVDQRADVYALGGTLYHMVTGVVPYEGHTAAVVMTRHLNDPLPDPRDHTPELSESTVAIIRHCMVKDREERYQDASRLREDIEAALAGKPLPHAAKPRPHVPAHARRLAERRAQVAARRRRKVLAAAVAAGVVVLGLALALLLGKGEDREAQARAEQRGGQARQQPETSEDKDGGDHETDKDKTTKTTVTPRPDPQALLQELVEDAETVEDRQAIARRFRQYIADFPDHAQQAKDHLARLRARWQAEDALQELRKKVREATGQQRFARALKLLGDPSLEAPPAWFTEQVEQLATEVRRAAARHVEAETERAEELIERGSYAEAKAVFQQLARLGIPAAVEASRTGLERVAKLEAERRRREAHRSFASAFLDATRLVDDGQLDDARKELHPDKADANPVLRQLLQAAQGDLDRIQGLFDQVEKALAQRARQGGQARIRGIMRPITRVEDHQVHCTLGSTTKSYRVYELTEKDIGELDCENEELLLPLLELYRGHLEEAKAGLAELPRERAGRYLDILQWVDALKREDQAAQLFAQARKLERQKNWQKAAQLVDQLLEDFKDTAFLDNTKNRKAVHDLAARCAAAIAEARRRAETIRPFIDKTDSCGDLAKALATLRPVGGWVVDIDNDGRLDVAIDIRHSAEERFVPVFLNRTKRGDPAPTFEDATRQAGIDTGDEPICWADFDGDGDLDIVCRGLWEPGGTSDHSKLSLYENRGPEAEPMFLCHRELALSPELAQEPGYRGGFGNIAVLDANGDGRADILAQYVAKARTLTLFLARRPKPSRRFDFLDASRQARFYAGRGAQVTTPELLDVKAWPQYVVFDCNSDHRADFILNADSGMLFVNRPGCRFEHLAADSVNYKTYVGPDNNPRIVPAVADYDSDGHMDIFVPQQERNLLLRNEGKGHFVDAMDTTGPMAVDEAVSLWATWADVNNDGLLDLFICNDGKRNRLYIQASNHAFVDKAEEYGVTGQPSEKTNFAAFGDLDRDGDLDMIILRDSGRNQLLVNPYIQGDNCYYLTVRLRPRLGAIGAMVYVHQPGGTLVGLQQVARVEGYNRQTSREAHFGVNSPGDYEVRVVLSNGTLARRRFRVKATGPNILTIGK